MKTDDKGPQGQEPHDKGAEGQGPKYTLDIEGKLIEWDHPTITTEEIASLGKWDLAQGVIQFDDDGNETTLQPSASIEIKPGMGFSKKVHWKRGDGQSLFDLRIHEEFAALRNRFGNVQLTENWILIPEYTLPDGWGTKSVAVAFQIPPSYPAAAPYGFYVPSSLAFNGVVPGSFQQVAANRPPFDGSWGMFSWAYDGNWMAAAEFGAGTNLVNYADGFHQRFREGA
ncbi:MAG: hypothetical protein JWR22_1357 [Herminiimonas sp.]|nr:hypothetical protein [Herminiimonas sp.]